MSGLGPFEDGPRIAVALSGGSDSLALALLAARWAVRQGGGAIGLTVDHGLRPEAALEARRVGAWLAARGVPHRILVWRGAKPAANLQAAARAARYRLLEAWCRQNAVLHLLIAHQREDQAETLLLRLARGSGLDGLAAMAPVSGTREVRILRPLLAVPRARLAATLAALRQDWIEDPSNQDRHHARVRVRALMPALADEGLTAERLAATAALLGRARRALEGDVARLLAESVAVDPAGYALVAPAALAAAAEEVALRALARVIQTIGGAVYPPRLDRLERLYRELVREGAFAARTLGGCRILQASGRQRAGGLLVCREPALVEAARPVEARERLSWDGRYELVLTAALSSAVGAVSLGALGEAGWAALVAASPRLSDNPLPAPVRPSLPALRDLEGLLAVPHLDYGRGQAETGTVYVRSLLFRPLRPLAIGPAPVA